MVTSGRHGGLSSLFKSRKMAGLIETMPSGVEHLVYSAMALAVCTYSFIVDKVLR